MAYRTNPLKNVQPVRSIASVNQRGKPKQNSMKLKRFNQGRTANLKRR